MGCCLGARGLVPWREPLLDLPLKEMLQWLLLCFSVPVLSGLSTLGCGPQQNTAAFKRSSACETVCYSRASLLIIFCKTPSIKDPHFIKTSEPFSAYLTPVALTTGSSRDVLLLSRRYIEMRCSLPQ